MEELVKMKLLILPILLLLLGIGLISGGIYYCYKYREDKEAIKIYKAVSVIGSFISIIGIIKLL